MTDPIKPEPTPADHLPIEITLTLGQINYVLAVLAKRPLEECFAAFMTLKQQGDAAVAKAAQPPVEPPADPGPPPAIMDEDDMALGPLILDKAAFLRAEAARAGHAHQSSSTAGD